MRQLCDDTSDTVLIENNGITPDWGCNQFCSDSIITAHKEVWGKIIFSVVCVKNSVHSMYPHPWADTPPPRAGTPPWAGTPPGRYTPPGAGTPPWAGTPQGSYTLLEAGTPKAGTPRQVHTPSRYYEIRSMSGQYASYWNAFLFSVRAVSLASSQSCGSVDAADGCKRALSTELLLSTKTRQIITTFW